MNDRAPLPAHVVQHTVHPQAQAPTVESVE
jgi:hypothetical protein